jgi:hypothetical protein
MPGASESTEPGAPGSATQIGGERRSGIRRRRAVSVAIATRTLLEFIANSNSDSQS